MSLKGDDNAGTAQVFGELAYGFSMGAARFEPFANLAYVNLHTDGFREAGGAAALTSASANTDTTFTSSAGELLESQSSSSSMSGQSFFAKLSPGLIERSMLSLSQQATNHRRPRVQSLCKGIHSAHLQQVYVTKPFAS